MFDNGSNEDTSDTTKEAARLLEISYHRNKSNLVMPRNFIKVVFLAKVKSYSFELSFLRHYATCSLYPNVYLCPLHLLFRKIKRLNAKR